MDRRRLKCKLCAYRSDDLVNHIETDHANHPEASSCADGVLVWYMKKFDVDENGVIFSGSTADSSEIKVGDKTVALPKGNGGEFVPTVNGSYHFGEFVTSVCDDINENARVMLTGHTGVGKTSLIEQLAARSANGFVRVNLNGQTTISDFVGLWSVRGGDMVWIDGALPKAMREGHWLILDEIDFAEPAILSVLNGVLERNGKLVLKEKGYEVVVPHENFRIFATANSVGCMSGFRGLYQGTNIMNEAFLDRWRVYHVDYLPADLEIKILVASVDKMTAKVATKIVQVASMIREAFKREEIQCTMSLRRLLDWSHLMIRQRDPMISAEAAILNKISPQDAEVIRGLIKRQMGEKRREQV